MREKLAAIEQHYEELNNQLMSVGDDYERAAELGKERSDLEPLVEQIKAYRQALQQLEDAQALLSGEEDDELGSLAEGEISELTPRIEELEQSIKSMLVPKDPRDERNVIVEIRAGTGGDEAALFAAELFRMYSRYAEKRNWKIDLMSSNEIGIGGFKEVIFMVKGKWVYSRMKYETGVHRVQRVPVTESQGRVHTSTATVAVLAEVDEVDVQIADSDLKIDVYKSAGAGGQNVQKNSTAIRMTHIPTGIVVQCQDERSQLQNRLRALSILRARLYEIEEEKRRSEIDETRRSQVGSGERSEKIRTYNYPQSRVTDHRINLTSYNLSSILEGNIDMFIDELSTRDESDRLATAGI